MAGVAGTTVGDDARHVIGELHVGNVVLMGPNVESPAQVREPLDIDRLLDDQYVRYAVERLGRY